MTPDTRLPRLLLETLLIIMSVEMLVMYLLPIVAPGATGISAAAIDASLLAIFAVPLVFWRVLHAAKFAAEGGTTNAGKGRWSVQLTTIAVLVTGVALSIFVAWSSHRNIQHEAQEKFDRLSERVVAEINRRARMPAYGLRGVRGLFIASEQVTRDEFRAYAASRDISSEFRGVRGFGFIERVSRQNLPAFTDRERLDNAPDFKVISSGEADDLYIIKFIDPRRRNRNDWGYDAGSEPVRRQAIEHAVHTGELTLTGRITLRDDASRGNGALYLLPVYRPGLPATTPAEREAALIGLVYAPMAYEDWMADIADAADGMLRIEITDHNSAKSRQLYAGFGAGRATTDGNSSALFKQQVGIATGTQTWVVKLHSTPQFNGTIDSSTPALLGIGGIVLSVILAALVWSMGRARARAISIAQQMTRDLSVEKVRVERAHAEAQASREQMEAFLDCAPISILVVDPYGEIRFSNRGIGKYGRNELFGVRLASLVSEDKQQALADAMRAATATAHSELTTFNMSMAAADGSWQQYTCHIGPMRHGDTLVGSVIAARDVTDELRVQAELSASQRLATVGSLAAGIAHEINTPVQFVGDSVHFLRDASTDVFALVDRFNELHQSVLNGADATELQEIAGSVSTAIADADLSYLLDNVPKAFDRSLDGLNRVATIVRSMKEFSHPAQKEMAAVDLNRAIENTLIVGRNEYKYVADVVTDYGELPAVMCHVNDINQVVLNMVVNASHAIGDVIAGTDQRGTITVRTRHEGNDVLISIADTGGGIPESARARIFDPFFTTKEVGKGTGQGLAIAWTIVREKHGGEIMLSTQMGVGTTFTIRLPVNGVAASTNGAAASTNVTQPLTPHAQPLSADLSPYPDGHCATAQ